MRTVSRGWGYLFVVVAAGCGAEKEPSSGTVAGAITPCIDDSCASDVATVATCGDDVVEGTEECEPIQGSCCNPATCTYFSAGTNCRPADGDCDVPEACTGDSAVCPADGVVSAASNTVCRGKTDACDQLDFCNGTSKDCPDLVEPAGTVCRQSISDCDAEEACDGTSTACPADGVEPATKVCRAAVPGGCDVAENCNGTTSVCPADVVQPAATVCRGSAGACDVVEKCDGSSPTCPTDLFASAVTVCRKAAAGGCDVAETCSGSSAACPANSFAPATTVCRTSAGVCDPQETCTGSSATCPADALAPSTTVCRTSAGVCDPQETCSGSSAACPADALAPSTTVCRASTGDCDPQETCSGSSAACPADDLAPSTTVCRLSTGVCDVEETCTGSSAACPPDGVAPGFDPVTKTGTLCRAAAGDCDQQEFCNGVDKACPTDQLRPSTYLCRKATGVCDVADYCTGTSVSCPADAVAPPFDPTTKTGTLCRAAAGDCDQQEFCDGTAKTCPADLLRPATFQCRKAVNECDVAENCTGLSTACPTNAFAPATTACTDDGSPCTTDLCTGTSALCSHLGDDCCSQVTSSSLCPLTDDLFRLIYLPDLFDGFVTQKYRLNASNPGQFYYNTFVTCLPANPVDLEIHVPYPFVTQGATPIQVFDAAPRNVGGCWLPGNPVAGCTIATEGDHLSPSGAPVILLGDYDPQNVGDTTKVTVHCNAAPTTGFVYVAIHLDYGVKKTTDWQKLAFNEAWHPEFASGDGPVTLDDPQAYSFDFDHDSGECGGTYTPTSTNVFKKNPGVNGLTLLAGSADPKPNVKVQLLAGGKVLGSTTTDQDGFYMILYKHKGKAATFTVKLPELGIQQNVQLKANGAATLLFDGLP